VLQAMNASGHMPRGSARVRALALALVALAARAGVAQQFRMPHVDLDFDKEVDFAGFKTYGWKDTGMVASDPSMHARIVWYVERELEKKGLRKAKDGEASDLLVRYYAKKQTGLKGTPSQERTTLPGGAGQLTTSVDFQTVLEGTLLLELQRASDAKPVWRASTDYKSIDKQNIDSETKSAVRLLLAKYPPPKS
jgi:hypothetical protein